MPILIVQDISPNLPDWSQNQGTSILFKISLMISSDVVLLASASYVSPIRWRNTSWHTALTSSGITYPLRLINA